MGCGWPGQDQTSVEALLPEHTGTGGKKKDASGFRVAFSIWQCEIKMTATLTMCC